MHPKGNPRLRGVEDVRFLFHQIFGSPFPIIGFAVFSFWARGFQETAGENPVYGWAVFTERTFFKMNDCLFCYVIVRGVPKVCGFQGFGVFF